MLISSKVVFSIKIGAHYDQLTHDQLLVRVAAAQESWPVSSYLEKYFPPLSLPFGASLGELKPFCSTMERRGEKQEGKQG